jgi:hypothetical protein
MAEVLFKSGATVAAAESGAPKLGVERNIHLALTDFNICQSIFREKAAKWWRAA